MIRQLRTLVIIISTAVPSVCATAPSWAQEDPFGGDPFGGLTTETEPASQPSPAEASTAEPVDDETDPAVLAIRDSDPQTPRELTKAVQLLLNLGRPDEAQTYLDRLAAAIPDADSLEQLQREFGSVLFLRLIRREDLQPAGAQFGNAVLDAALAASRSPQRLASMIQQLQDPSPAIRRAAILDLQQASEAAAEALLAALADPTQQSFIPVLQTALRKLGRYAIDPMIAALNSQRPQLQVAVMQVLAQERVDEALPFLLRPALSPDSPEVVRQAAINAIREWLDELPTVAEATRFLTRRARARLRDTRSGFREVNELELVWTWDETAGRVRSEEVSPEIKKLRRAAALSRQAYRLAPQDPQARRLYFVTTLEDAQRSHGIDSPLPLTTGIVAELSRERVGDIEQLLAFALDEHQPAAAVATLQLLGKLGNESLLASSGGRLSTIAQALKHFDRRVQFAAAMAIVEMDPREPFAGSSYVLENLAFFIRSAGTRRALVAHPRADEAQTLIGALAELGVSGESVTTGRRAVQQSRRQPDYEFIILSSILDGPPIAEALQQIRRDPRTAQVPVGVIARQDRFPTMQRLTESDPLSETFSRPHSLQGINLIARRLLARGGARQIPYETRIQQAQRALQAMGDLTEQKERYPFYDLLRHQPAIEQALFQPVLQRQAARVLGAFGTPSAQQLLVTVASQNVRPLPQRQAAADALTHAIETRGLLLTREEVLRQYDRYNRSRTLDRDTQKVLGKVLDAIESPTRKTADNASSGPLES